MAGVLFPFELFPKVTDSANPYKAEIQEFRPPSQLVADSGQPPTDGGPISTSVALLGLRFLLVLVPLSLAFGLRSMSQEVRREPSTPFQKEDRSGPGGTTLVLCFFVAAIDASLVLGRRICPDWWLEIAQALPVVIALGGVILAGSRLRTSDRSGWVLGAAAIAAAGWLWWLGEYFAGAGGRGLPELGVPGLAAALCAGYLFYRYLRDGGDPFPVLLVGAFGYLALGAATNGARFGFVCGVVLVWNLRHLQGSVRDAPPITARNRSFGAVVPILVGAILTAWLAGCACGLSWLPGAVSAQSFQEHRRLFPHDAIQFAGREGMPDRALVCGLEQSNVYVYHNGPARKTYMDARLEVPSLATFQNYLTIEKLLSEGDPHWADAVARLDNPLVILAHMRTNGPRVAHRLFRRPSVGLPPIRRPVARGALSPARFRRSTLPLPQRAVRPEPPLGGRGGGGRARTLWHCLARSRTNLVRPGSRTPIRPGPLGARPQPSAERESRVGGSNRILGIGAQFGQPAAASGQVVEHHDRSPLGATQLRTAGSTRTPAE
jgi:hypothetical protein